MTKVKRNWDILSEEERQKAIKEIIDYFYSERREEIGVIAAGGMLDMFLQTSGILLYNKGVEDTKEFVKKRLEEVNIDIEVSLKKDQTA